MKRTGEGGFALVAVMFVMLLLLGLGASFHTGILAETLSRGAHARATAGFYAAEAGINHGMDTYRNIFLNYNVPTGADYNAHSITVNSRNVTYQLADLPPNPKTRLIAAGKPFAGLNATEYNYTVNSTSQLIAGQNEVNIGTQFDVDYVPLFQFLAFYAGDLEILPGPNMTMHGPVHTNGNLYMNSSGNTLTINELLPTIPAVHVSAVGNIFRGRKDANSCDGTVNIAKLVDADHSGALDLQAMACSGTSTTQMTSATLASWLGAVQARVPNVSVPTPAVLTRATPGPPPVGGGQFWLDADLRIVLDLDAPDVNGRFPIVAQTSTGAVDAAKTASLQAFMVAYPGRIFYNDVPNNGQAAPPTGGATCNAATPPPVNTHCNSGSYTPAFGIPAIGAAEAVVYGCPGSGGPSNLDLYPGCANRVGNVAYAGSGTVSAATAPWTARRGGFYNNRERNWVYMLNVNAHDLLKWNRDNGGALFDPNDNTEGGVVLFLSVKGPNSGGVSACTMPGGNPKTCSRYGVRVYGSPNLDFPAGMADPTGLTVVSDQGVYVEGDYNTGGGGFPKMPAAFMGDTINVLTNNWSGNPAAAGWAGATRCRNDCQSRWQLAARPGAATTVYAAFLAGVDTTTAGVYNGGLENYPRFHEDWGGAAFTYRGSFVSLGTPAHANGSWCSTGGSCTYGSAGCPSATALCNIYNPPTRAWDYDTDFQNVANLPPITPRFVTVQQIVFTENFR